MTLSIHPLTSEIGAELRGLELRESLAPELVKEIRGALLEYLVVFIRDQQLDETQHLSFCAAFGPIVPSVGRRGSDSVDGITVLDQVMPKGLGADEWHSDHMFSAEPPLGTVLRAVKLPRVGGDTLYTSMFAAYDALSEPMQRFLNELTAEHSNERTVAKVKDLGIYENDFDNEKRTPVRHPVVRVHPESGRRALYVSSRDTLRICELSEIESDGLLRTLFEHQQDPTFQCRFRWEPGSIAFWDNRAVQHRAIPDYTERRIMHRTMVGGGGPVVGPLPRTAEEES